MGAIPHDQKMVSTRNYNVQSPDPSLAVPARNDERLGAQSKAVSGARSLRLKRSLNAPYGRLDARSLRRTRDQPTRRTLVETHVGSPAARISSMSSCVRLGSRSPRRSRRISAGFASNCSTRLRMS